MNSVLMLIIIAAVVVIGVSVYTYVIGAVPFEYDGLFSNLLNGMDQWLDSPVVVAALATIIVSTAGWLENWTQTGEAFEAKHFAQTFFLYEGVMILFSQALPIEYALVASFVIDVLRRIALRMRPQPPTVKK